jgi:hypothetical protein
MADVVTSQTLHDEGNSVVMYFTNQSDGTGESGVVKVDVSTLQGAPMGVAIKAIRGSTIGMSVKVLWDATTPTLAATVATDHDTTQVYDPPLCNSSGTGKTGDIKFTTVGHSSGDAYNIWIEMVKVP